MSRRKAVLVYAILATSIGCSFYHLSRFGVPVYDAVGLSALSFVAGLIVFAHLAGRSSQP